MNYLPHLKELRTRLLRCGLLTLGLFCLCFYFAHDLFKLIATPLLNVLPHDTNLVATHLTSTLITPLKLAANSALLLALPFWVYQLWQFIAPGLHHQEKRLLTPLFATSLLLLLCGMLFCYFIVLPTLFHFFTTATPQGVRLMPDITYYFDFVSNMMLIFALCFQLPLIIALLIRSQLLSVTQLKSARPYVIVSAFIIGMLLTPPDVISQLLLAVPLCLLYELGIFAGHSVFTNISKRTQGSPY